MQTFCMKHAFKCIEHLTLGVCAVVWAEFVVACQCSQMDVVGTEAQGRALILAYSCTLMWQLLNCTSANSDPPGDAPPAGQERHAFCLAKKQGLYKPILKVQNKCHLKVRACSSRWQHVLIEWIWKKMVTAPWNVSRSASVSWMCGIYITAFSLRNTVQWELICKEFRALLSSEM